MGKYFGTDGFRGEAGITLTADHAFLLNKDGKLEVMKKYNGSKRTSVLLKAFHPTNPQCADLHLKKRNELMICHVSLENIFLTFIRSQARTKWGGFCKIFCVRNRKNCTVLV